MNESSRRFRVLRFAFVNGVRRCSSFLSCLIFTQYSFFNVLFLSRQLGHPYRNYFAVYCTLRIVEQITITISYTILNVDKRKSQSLQSFN